MSSFVVSVTTGFLVIVCVIVSVTVPTQGEIASAVTVNSTKPLAISIGPGVYSVSMVFIEAEKVPSPPLLDHVMFVTLDSVASKIEILAPSQIF